MTLPLVLVCALFLGSPALDAGAFAKPSHTKSSHKHHHKRKHKKKKKKPTPSRPNPNISTSPTQVVGKLSDGQAASSVSRVAENRPDNVTANRTVPTASQLASFRAGDSSMPASYLDRIDGNYRGTTDEIIQWASYKWGLDPDLLRAVAAYESWWHMYTVGDQGNAFGLYQIDDRYHCCQQLARNDTAFNADYYGAIIRSYYDGVQTWLNTVSGNGARYQAGELWNSLGYWGSGRWADSGSQSYVRGVQTDLAGKPWKQPFFTGG